jgi:hypothetical protein
MSVYDPTPQMEAIMTVPTWQELHKALRLVSNDSYLEKRITRQRARETGLTRFFTGIECSNGHIADRIVSNGLCIECQRMKWSGK